MKRLTRNKLTRAYWGKDGNWTEACSAAMDFPNVTAMLQAASEIKKDIELEEFLMVGELPSSFDVILPLWPKE